MRRTVQSLRFHFFVARQVQEQLFSQLLCCPSILYGHGQTVAFVQGNCVSSKVFLFGQASCFFVSHVSCDFAAFRIFASSFNLGWSDGPEYCFSCRLTIEGCRSQIDCSKFRGPKAEGERKVHKVQTQALGPSKKRYGTLLSDSELGVKSHVPDGMIGYD